MIDSVVINEMNKHYKINKNKILTNFTKQAVNMHHGFSSFICFSCLSAKQKNIYVYFMEKKTSSDNST